MPKDGESPYYGKAREYLTAYKATYHGRDGDVPDPILSEINEMVVVLSGHSKPHGHRVLFNGVIQPTVKYT